MSDALYKAARPAAPPQNLRARRKPLARAKKSPVRRDDALFAAFVAPWNYVWTVGDDENIIIRQEGGA